MGDSTKSPVFMMGSPKVTKKLIIENLENFSQYVENLLAKNLPVMIYAGEFDSLGGPAT